ncbi:MAG TPA: DUF4190 domain-containing protein [Pirellulaceae bacterium]|nr:DUF4190 domain-containing protein [Pirellulaceae bacterium]
MTTDTYIDSLCGGCGKRLRVAGEHAGRKARCPHCQLVYTVPLQNTVSSAGYEMSIPAPPTGESWQVKSPDGLVYGPVSKEELDGWRDAGRITHRSQLLPRGGQQWLWATEVYPDLTPAAPMTPVAMTADAAPSAPRTPTLHSYYARGIQPHRGPLVLALAIVGIFTLCAAPSLIGLILGLYDLRLMKREKMDPAGRGLTIAGIVVSIGFIILNMGVFVLALAAWLR